MTTVTTLLVIMATISYIGSYEVQGLKTYDWDYGQTAAKTFLFTNSHWWESLDHQMTTAVTLLALAQNTSSTAVIPALASAGERGRTNVSILGGYFSLQEVRKVQRVVTYLEFLQSEDFELLQKEAKGSPGTVKLPKESQEEYEKTLGIYGELETARIKLQMPNVDPENTNQPCDWFGGTMHVSQDGTRRYVFLERLHFLHFCTEKFMPWWYDVRIHIKPREEFMRVAKLFMTHVRRPLTVVHVNDVMEKQKMREDVEIERYARQIVDALRVNDAIEGSVYAIFHKGGRNVMRVVTLLRLELDRVHECGDMLNCLQDVGRDVITETVGIDDLFERLFRSEHSVKMAEWALAAEADVFIANIHSPYSRNIALFRKTHGSSYSAVRGFAELRKVWSWNLR